MIKNMKSAIASTVVTPMDMKREVPPCELNATYDWKEQRSSDTFKFGTGGNTSQYSPGQIVNDNDSYTD